MRRIITVGLVGVAATAVLAGCSSSGGSGGGSGVRIVASTDVWGSVATQVAGTQAGKAVSITSIITDPSADPHSYESNARTQLAIKRADVVIENGGGYDDFMETLRKASGTKADVLNAVDISGKKAPAGGELNEHVWYDFPTVIKVADKIAADLATADSTHAATYKANAAAFATKVDALEKTEAQIKSAHAGAGVAITEPVPLYLLQACGLVNRTPAEFSEAIENGTDVPVSVLRTTEALFTQKQVKLLAYNEQTSGAETEQVLSTAKKAGVAVVPVTETLPSGKDYLTWMTANLQAVRTALGG